MGKGSQQRPRQVSAETWRQHRERTFAKRTPVVVCRECGARMGFFHLCHNNYLAAPTPVILRPNAEP